MSVSGPTATTATTQSGAMPSKAAATRERLVLAARELIEAGGYAAAPVAAIAGHAGVAAGTLYRHFPSKADLFLEVFRTVSEDDLAAMRGAAAEAGSAGERLDAVVETYVRRSLRSPRLAWALAYEPVDLRVDAERLTHRRTYRDGMAGLLREGIAAGDLPEQDAELTAAAIVGVIYETLLGPLSPVEVGVTSEAKTVAAIATLGRRLAGAGG